MEVKFEKGEQGQRSCSLLAFRCGAVLIATRWDLFVDDRDFALRDEVTNSSRKELSHGLRILFPFHSRLISTPIITPVTLTLTSHRASNSINPHLVMSNLGHSIRCTHPG